MKTISSPLTLKDLPLPPSGKIGYPWTEHTEPVAHLSQSTLLPCISIVTPSYNQGQFIEETIRSVLLQGYFNLEYIIIDGGSTDNTVEIIKKYANYLNYWVSEPDNGQSHAINKGLKKITGDIWAYINSDDRYEKGTFQKVARQFRENSDLLWVTGHAEYVNVEDQLLENLIPSPFKGMKETLIRWEGPRVASIQASNFMSSKVLENYGLFDESLHYCMDAEFNMRLLADGVTPGVIPTVLAKARLHTDSKTISKGGSSAFIEEDLQIARRFLSILSKQDHAFVKNKIAECQFFLDLGKLVKLHETGQTTRFMTETLRILIQHPSYLSQRASWGMFRRVLGFSKK